MKFLKKLSEQASFVSLKALLLRNLTRNDPPRSLARIHMSDLTNNENEYCPREVILLQKLGLNRKSKYLPASLSYTFDEGRDKQSRLNNDWLVNEMVGDWKCSSCGDVRSFCKKPKGACPDTMTSKFKCNWVYEECRFQHVPSKASGGIDGLVDFKKGKLRLIECKIMSKDEFKALVAPLAEHKLRTQAYLRAVAESDHLCKDHVELSEAHIIYMIRGYGCKDEDGDMTPFKEYTVQRDDARVDYLFARAHAVTACRTTLADKTKEGVASYRMPGGVCSNAMCKRAAKCSVSKECFSGKYPLEVTWVEEGALQHQEAKFSVTSKLVVTG